MAERNPERAAHVASSSAQARFAAKLRSIAAQANNTRSTGFRIPVVDSDPSTDFPTNLWGFDDGRIRWRGTDGEVHELTPSDQQPIQTLSATPAASTNINLWVGTDGMLHARQANGNVVTYAPMVQTLSSTPPSTGPRLWVGTDGVLHVRQADGTVLNYSPDASHTSTADTTSTSSTGGGSGGSTTTKPKQSDPSPTKHRRTWDATWGKAFNGVRGPETSTRLHYGRYDSTWGERRIMIGFNDSSIRSALSGADIRNVELHMQNTDSWAHSGVDVHWGAHNRSGAPGGYSAVRRDAFTDHWPEAGDGAYWRSIPNWFGRAFRDNDIKGLTIDQPLGLQYYGEMRWASVSIRITYVS